MEKMTVSLVQLSGDFVLVMEDVKKIAKAKDVYIIRTIAPDVIKKYDLTSPISIHPFGSVWERAVKNDTTDALVWDLMSKRSVLVMVS
jgi:hypothetical protein